MDLQQRFHILLTEIGFETVAINQYWKDLEKAYSSKSRHYHDLKHIETMVHAFDAWKAHLQFPNEILYGIFYHDIVYDATRKDNELKSAILAVEKLPEQTSIDKNLVYEAILATKMHEKNAIEDINWLLDFDLLILAEDWDFYKNYCQQIRKEYKIYPDFLYNPGRKKALQHFLKSEFIFQTKLFRSKYEWKARENIQREIAELL